MPIRYTQPGNISSSPHGAWQVRAGNRSGGGDAWSPADISSAIHWYKTRLETYANDDPVGTFTDQIGSADLTSTGTERPLFKTNSGDPYLEFDGINDKLVGTVESLTDGTIIFIMEFIADTGYDAMYVGGFMWANAGGSAAFQPFTPNNQYVGGYPRSFPSGNVSLFIERVGSTQTVRKDGSEQSGSVTPSAGDTTFAISGNVLFAGFTTINVRELIVCNAGITAGEFADLAAYLFAEYGVTL